MRYEIDEKVFLKVSPWKKVMRFGKNCKLSPKFIGPYEVKEKVGSVAYKIALPQELEKIHNFFPCVNVEEVHVKPITCSLFGDD